MTIPSISSSNDDQQVKESPRGASPLPGFTSDEDQRSKYIPQDTTRIRAYFTPTPLSHDICNQIYPGEGTSTDPYVIDYLPNDAQDPMNMSMPRKIAITFLQAMSAMIVTFSSSAYASGIADVMTDYHVSEEVATLGLSMFVLGFALGPLIWGPLSEL
jgi:hypothetical protein